MTQENYDLSIPADLEKYKKVNIYNDYSWIQYDINNKIINEGKIPSIDYFEIIENNMNPPIDKIIHQSYKIHIKNLSKIYLINDARYFRFIDILNSEFKPESKDIELFKIKDFRLEELYDNDKTRIFRRIQTAIPKLKLYKPITIKNICMLVNNEYVVFDDFTQTNNQDIYKLKFTEQSFFGSDVTGEHNIVQEVQKNKSKNTISIYDIFSKYINCEKLELEKNVQDKKKELFANNLDNLFKVKFTRSGKGNLNNVFFDKNGMPIHLNTDFEVNINNLKKPYKFKKSVEFEKIEGKSYYETKIIKSEDILNKYLKSINNITDNVIIKYLSSDYLKLFKQICEIQKLNSKQCYDEIFEYDIRANKDEMKKKILSNFIYLKYTPIFEKYNKAINDKNIKNKVNYDFLAQIIANLEEGSINDTVNKYIDILLKYDIGNIIETKNSVFEGKIKNNIVGFNSGTKKFSIKVDSNTLKGNSIYENEINIKEKVYHKYDYGDEVEIHDIEKARIKWEKRWLVPINGEELVKPKDKTRFHITKIYRWDYKTSNNEYNPLV